MRKLLAIAAVAALSGCMNLYTRFPTTSAKVERVYQSSREMAAISVIAAFPQMMSDCPSDSGLMWENLISVPFLGLPCAVDAVLEACVDTVCLPADWPLSAYRKEAK